MNLIGIVASPLIYLRRAGFTMLKETKGIDWREFLIPNVPYFLLTFVKILTWPAVLTVWVIQGLPPSRWKAVTELDGLPVRRVMRLPAADRESLFDRGGDLSGRTSASALEAAALRLLSGENPWGSGENHVLGNLALRLDGVSRDEAGTATLFDELEMAAARGGLVALGIWFMISDCGPADWRNDSRVQEWFIAGITAASRNSGASRFTYRCDEIEESLIRRTEPRGGPLWRFVRPQPSDLVERSVPPPGAEPAIADLADGEQHHLATVGSNYLYATRRHDGTYATIRVTAPVNGEDKATEEDFASAPTLTGLLRATGIHIGRSIPDWVHRDLAPYIPAELPEWWPR